MYVQSSQRVNGYERSIATSQSSDFDAGVCGGACLVRAGLSEDGAPSSAWQRLAMQPDGSSDKLYLRESARANIGVEAADEYRQRRRTSAFTEHLDL